VALAAGWAQVLDQAVDVVQGGLRLLLGAGVPTPEVGYELADARGRVIAEAELAWFEARLVVLTEDQVDGAGVWLSHGWTVVSLSTLTDAEGDGDPSAPAWAQAVVSKIKTGGTA